LRGYLETGNKKRKGVAADAGASVEAGGLIGGIDYEHNAHGPPYSRTGNERVEAEALAISFTPGNLVRKASPNPSSETFPTLSKDSGDQNPHVATPMAVRRLTPVECERLQGFPDNWSRIPWKGKPEAECPDGPRYKACGNSMAVPVMAFIGKRIAEVEAKGHQS
jgi:site-specific DNA-cytosine methylase